MQRSIIINNQNIRLIQKGSVIYFNIYDICIVSNIDHKNLQYPVDAYCDINVLWDILSKEEKYDIWKQCKALKPSAASGPYSIIY
jgi:hypothetical protein